MARANLCEILAIKLLSSFATNYIELVAVLTTTWNPLAGATNDVMNVVKQTLNAHDDDIAYAQSAIEVCNQIRKRHIRTEALSRWQSLPRQRHFLRLQ